MQSKLKVVKKLQEEMDAIPAVIDDPMLHFQFVDVMMRGMSEIAANAAVPDSAVERHHLRLLAGEDSFPRHQLRRGFAVAHRNPGSERHRQVHVGESGCRWGVRGSCCWAS